MIWIDTDVSTYLTSQHIGILQSLVNLTLLQVILWSLSFHLLVKLLLVLHLLEWIHVRISLSRTCRVETNQRQIHRHHL